MNAADQRAALARLHRERDRARAQRLAHRRAVRDLRVALAGAIRNVTAQRDRAAADGLPSPGEED